MSYLDELNEPQRAAVEYIDGPALVIAGAGSGKTRVLTYKIMHLLENGYQPWNILAITFTNKAAREMKERIAQKIGEEKSASLWMGTFHSIFLKILRMEISKTEYKPNFTIYDAEDAKKLVKGIVKDLKLDDKKYPVNEVYARSRRRGSSPNDRHSQSWRLPPSGRSPSWSPWTVFRWKTW